MKRILLSTVVLLSFSFSIILFQLSCKKPSYADIPTSSTPISLNLVIYSKSFSGNGKYYEEVWTCTYDGSNQKKINIQLPTGVQFSESVTPALSPDGKTIFFTAGIPQTGMDIPYSNDMYSCNIDGSNVKKIVDKGNASSITNIAIR